MSRIISVVSAKGGAGKTTVSANLAAALAARGHSVIAVDGNVTTPNLSLHLGIPLAKTTLHDVLHGKADVMQAVYKHPAGFRVLPASLALGKLKGLSLNKLSKIVGELLGHAEIILIDSAAGLGKEAIAAIEIADEVIFVTNPELTAVTDAVKAVKIADEVGAHKIGTVLNRVKGRAHEMTPREVWKMLEVPIIAIIPEDSAVQRSISRRNPVVCYAPGSRAAREFHKLAGKIVGETDMPEPPRGWFFALLDTLAKR